MLPLEVIFRLLDGLREEAIDAAERPGEDSQSEFGFGKVSGMLRAIRAIRARVEEAVAEEEKQDDDAQG